MSVEKPLHVRVAEALGCKPIQSRHGNDWHCACKGWPHSEHAINDNCHSQSGLGCDNELLADYDTDWSATGPLIERYGICLNQGVFKRPYPEPPIRGEEWMVTCWDASIPYGLNAKPLVAVCELLLALSEAGKLKAA